ncbi:hypothetical protein TNCV_3798301 [Trichonephila clavipes]|nr:hypothetical protein TNCV_3798301 [Trichonephila clavipes]
MCTEMDGPARTLRSIESDDRRIILSVLPDLINDPTCNRDTVNFIRHRKATQRMVAEVTEAITLTSLVTNLYGTFPLIFFGDCKFVYISNQLKKEKMG